MEQQLFDALRQLLVALVQHRQSWYEHLFPYLARYDAGQWQRYEAELQLHYLGQLRSLIFRRDGLDEWYLKTPELDPNLLERLTTALDAYTKALKAAA